MSVAAGKHVLLKIEQSSGTGNFVTVAGLKIKTFTLKTQSLDITHCDSPGQWRELLGGAGVRGVDVSGAGVFVNGEADQIMRQRFFDQALCSFQLCLPEFAILSGPFLITELEYSGRHDGEAAYALSLASAGAISVTVL